jgi:predicted site-specific integrase-resolvase
VYAVSVPASNGTIWSSGAADDRFANAAGLSVVAVIKEVGSGVNDTLPKVTALLKEDSWGTLVVEQKDRLSRVG